MSQPTRKGSDLAQFKIISPNTNPRAIQIPGLPQVKLIALHHAAGNISPRNLLSMPRFATNQFGNSGASCHYATRGKEIGRGADETRRTWTTSSQRIDRHAITVEMANSRNDSPDWPMTDETVNTTAELVVDCAKFYGFDTVAFYGDPENFGLPNELVIVFHSWYSRTLCAGPWFERNVRVFVEVCNRLIQGRQAVFRSINGRDAVCVVDEQAPPPPPAALLPQPNAPVEPIGDIAVGETVQFTGGHHFTSSTATKGTGSQRRAGRARVTSITNRGTQTIHLVGEPGGSNVHGWVNASNVERLNTTPAPSPQPPAAPATPPAPAPVQTEFQVRITVPALNVRREPSANAAIVRQLVNDPNLYTIIEERDGWGRLRSGLGWISLQHTRRI